MIFAVIILHFDDEEHKKYHDKTTIIFVEGGKKRQYIEHLGKFIKCQDCGFDIFAGSRLQPYFCQLILCMIHSLVPFELLDPLSYKQYYEDYFQSKDIKITTREEQFQYFERHTFHTNTDQNENSTSDSSYYFTNCNKIWNQMYFFLFAQLIGSQKTTRYQHMLAYTSEFYCHNAYVLHSTPRALYGTDPGEHYNDKVKSLVHSMTNRFAKSSSVMNMPEKTIDTVMRYCIWNYYNVQEKTSETDCRSIQSKLKKIHILSDEKILLRPCKIMQYFKDNDINYQLYIPTFDQIGREYYEKYKHKIVPFGGLDGESKSEDNILLQEEIYYRKHHELRLRWLLSDNLDSVQLLLNKVRESELRYADEIIDMC